MNPNMRTVVDLPAAANFKRMLAAMHKQESSALSPGMQCQVAKLLTAISCSESGSDSASSQLPGDALAACEAIQAASAADDSADQPLFAAIACLPESAGFLAACKCHWERQLQGSAMLGKISEVKHRLEEATNVHVDQLDLDKVLEDTQAIEQLAQHFAGNEEEGHVVKLASLAQVSLAKLVDMHVQRDLMKHMASVFAHFDSQLQLPEPPQWDIMRFETVLGKFEKPVQKWQDTTKDSNRHFIFEVHSLLLECARALDEVRRFLYDESGKEKDASATEPSDELSERCMSASAAWWDVVEKLVQLTGDRPTQQKIHDFSNKLQSSFLRVWTVEAKALTKKCLTQLASVLCCDTFATLDIVDARLDRAACERLLRVSSVESLSFGEHYQKCGHVSLTLVHLIKSYVTFEGFKGKLEISAKPSKESRQALKSIASVAECLKDIQRAGGFRSMIDGVASEAFPQDRDGNPAPIATVAGDCAETPPVPITLDDLVQRLEAFPKEHHDWVLSVQTTVDRLTEQDVKAIKDTKIPDYQHDAQDEFMKEFGDKSEQRTKHASTLRKRLAAATLCFKLAGIDDSDLEPHRTVAHKAMSAISTYSVAKLATHPAWHNDRHDEVHAALKEALEFVRSTPGVDLLPVFEAEANSRLKPGASATNEEKK